MPAAKLRQQAAAVFCSIAAIMSTSSPTYWHLSCYSFSVSFCTEAHTDTPPLTLKSMGKGTNQNKSHLINYFFLVQQHLEC